MSGQQTVAGGGEEPFERGDDEAVSEQVVGETAQRSDRRGELAGVPYDGKLKLADGQGQWWEGLDPQDLYAQNHPPGTNRGTGEAWHWDLRGGFLEYAVRLAGPKR